MRCFVCTKICYCVPPLHCAVYSCAVDCELFLPDFSQYTSIKGHCPVAKILCSSTFIIHSCLPGWKKKKQHLNLYSRGLRSCPFQSLWDHSWCPFLLIRSHANQIWKLSSFLVCTCLGCDTYTKGKGGFFSRGRVSIFLWFMMLCKSFSLAYFSVHHFVSLYHFLWIWSDKCIP